MLIHNSEDLGNIIKEARKKQGLTQAALAATSGVGIRFIIELEKGKPTASLSKVIHVIKMLGIDIDLKVPEVKSHD